MKLNQNEVHQVLDVAAQYCSTQHEASDQQWYSVEELVAYLSTDHIPENHREVFLSKFIMKDVMKLIPFKETNSITFTSMRKKLMNWSVLDMKLVERILMDFGHFHGVRILKRESTRDRYYLDVTAMLDTFAIYLKDILYEGEENAFTVKELMELVKEDWTITLYILRSMLAICRDDGHIKLAIAPTRYYL